MSEPLKIEQLISEKNLAEALGISRSSLLKLRQEGLPWVSLAGKTFYHESSFMEWIMKNRIRIADVSQESVGEE